MNNSVRKNQEYFQNKKTNYFETEIQFTTE